ncbi:isopeptide-forming domain-containing fimbrial protein [Lampropedia puyangensis]|nr:isopeptide-forming domain-containing fimbrial protein [Lampropedia puyangensis]
MKHREWRASNRAHFSVLKNLRYAPLAKTSALVISLGLACTAHAATNYDILVNHEAFFANPTTESVTGVVDGPAGGEFVYRAKIKLNGAATDAVLDDVVLSQSLPAGALFLGTSSTEASANVKCTDAPTIGAVIAAPTLEGEFTTPIHCTVSGVNFTKFVEVDFHVRLPSEGTEWKAYASASSASNVDPDQSSESPNHSNIERNVTTYEAADLAIAFTSPTESGSYKQGDVVFYTLVASNANSEYAFDLKAGEMAVVRFPLPSGTAFQSTPSGNGWNCQQKEDSETNPPVAVQECTYTVPAGQKIAKGSSLPPLTIPVLLNASGTVAATASVTGLRAGGQTFEESESDNNSTHVSIAVATNNALDMALAKRVSPSVVDALAAGGSVPVTYTLTASRVSGSVAIPENVQLKDTLPDSISGIEASGGADWNCTVAGQTVTCDYEGVMPSNGTYPVVTIKGELAVSATKAGEKVENNAAVSASNETDVAKINNSAKAVVEISNNVRLSINKTRSDSVVASGQPYSYTITVKNEGPLDVLPGQTITVHDQLDERLTFDGLDTDSATAGWKCADADASNLVTCTFANGLAKNATTQLKLNVHATLADPNSFATVKNTAKLVGVDGRGGNFENAVSNEASVNFSTKSADLMIEKSAQVSGNAVSGAEVVYTLKMKNQTVSTEFTQTAKTVVVEDTINNLIIDNYAGAPWNFPKYDNDRFIEVTAAHPNGDDATGLCKLSGTNNDKSAKVTCTFTNVPVSDTDEYTVVIKARQYVDPTSNSEPSNKITNTATVSSEDTADSNSKNNSDSAEVTLTALTDVRLSRTASLEKAAAGQAITYTITAKNHGPSAARGIKVVETLPIGTFWVGSAATVGGGGECTLNGGLAPTDGMEITASNNTLTCTWPESFVLTENNQEAISYLVRSAGEGYADTLKSSAVVSTVTPEITKDNNTANTSIPLDEPNVDVLISMQHSDDGLKLKDEETQYTITVTNSGASTSYATGVHMENAFPASGSTAAFEFVKLVGVTGVSRFSADNCKVPAQGATSGAVVCDFPWMAPNETVQIRFTMKPVELLDGRAVGTVNHNATVSADVERLNSGLDTSRNNSTRDRTSTYDPASVSDPDALRFVDLSLTKTVQAPQPAAVSMEDVITYRLVVKNEEDPQGDPRNDLVNGNAIVTDVLPPYLALDGAPPNGCRYEESSRTLTCTVTDLAAGAETSFEFKARVVNLPANADEITNTAQLVSPGDPDESNNEDKASVTLPKEEADLSIFKTTVGVANDAILDVGDTLTYSLTIRNESTSDTSRSATATDVIPPALELTAFPNDRCAYTETSRTLVCQVGVLAPEQSTSIQLETQVISIGQEISNTATVSAPKDTNPDNDTSTITVPTRNVEVDLSVGITVVDRDNKTPVKPGEELTYLVTVTNVETDPTRTSTPSTVTITLPPGTELDLTKLPPACTYDEDSHIVLCQVGELMPGESVDFSLPVKVKEDIKEITLPAKAVVSNDKDYNPDNNIDEVDLPMERKEVVAVPVNHPGALLGLMAIIFAFAARRRSVARQN